MSDPWSQQLEKDLNWREAELASMKLVLLEAPKGSVKQRTLLRAAWALLYAHYEGFVKFAWDIYLDALQSKKLPRNQACDNLVVLSLTKELQRMKGAMRIREAWEYCDQDFLRSMQESLMFETRLETKSNLWPDLLRENNNNIGLSCKEIDNNEIKLKTLVSRRNAIAHGQNMVIKDIEEYQIYEDSVIIVIHEIAISIVDSLSNHLYVKTP